MPATTITTKTEVKLLIGITATDYDTLFDKLCLWVTDYIQAYCGKKFIEETITNELYNSKDFKDTFWLNNAPAKSITSIEKKASDNSWEALEVDDDYEINLNTGEVRLGYVDSGLADIRVTYVTAGQAIPKALEMAATEMVAALYNRRSNQGMTQESLGEATIQWGATVSKDNQDILDRYRRASSFVA